MAITGEHIHNFQYINDKADNIPSALKEYLTKRIEDVESKHVANYSNETKRFFKYSEVVGYPNTLLGFHKNSNIQNEYFRIINMSQTVCNRTVRFVITKDNRIWSDNTHWTLAYLIQNGHTTLLSDIPAYIIDFRNLYPIVFDKDNIVFDSLYDIKSAIASAKRIQDRLDLGWRPSEDSYTIRQLYNDITNILNGEI